MTTEEAIKQLEGRIEDIRREDKDIRHEHNKVVNRAIESLQMRILQLETDCNEQEAVCNKTKIAVDRLVSVMQGDPEMEAVGFLKRQTDALRGIEEKITKLEDDKVESRTHRQIHAPLPSRVSSLEQSQHDQQIRLDTLAKAGKTVWIILGFIWPAMAAAACYFWNLFGAKP